MKVWEDLKNGQIDQAIPYYTYLGNSLLVEITNDICVKYSMAPQAYKVINTHANEFSGWKILYILLHYLSPHTGGINGGVMSCLSTMELINGE